MNDAALQMAPTTIPRASASPTSGTIRCAASDCHCIPPTRISPAHASGSAEASQSAAARNPLIDRTGRPSGVMYFTP